MSYKRLFGEEEYSLDFFKEKGFTRKRCKLCGEYFWTLDPDREVCGEAPCVEYTFIGNPPTSKRLTLDEVREAFLSFFEREGHKRIGRYPVVARWRDDLFLTDASIVDFQPYVTEGLIPPPANPLCISQPCIRLVDIDKVGITFGRHLTIFEMMAGHAFNYKGKIVYWKDRTVELHHNFVTKVLGVPEEKITYKEGVWEGGGNAGPDLESCVDGLEVATLVFMKFKVLDGRYVEMDTKIVDTGYGLERFTWLVNGTPSAFDVIYGDLIDKFCKVTGVEKPPVDVMVKAAKYSALMRKVEVGKNLDELRAVVARRIGVDVNELKRLLEPIEAVYALADHTKCLAFMLADGLVPSNMGEGYLGRLVLRRALRYLIRLGVERPLSEFVALQLKYWGRTFPELLEEEDRILEVVELEEKRYRETLSRGERIVERDVKKYRAKGVYPLERVIELYDSHGIPPELVKEKVEKMGLKVEVPDNFYEVIAQRHYKPEVKPKASVYDRYEEYLKKLPETKLLYYEDPRARRFRARVLACLDGRYVVLDKTAFYPEGGGQLYDTGYIKHSKGVSRVLEVQKHKHYVIHVVDKPVPAGEEVECEIDWNRRARLTRHHTATHIILGAARRVLGSHVWQAGSKKDENEARLDISHYKRISREELEKIEELANKVVMENRKVNVKFVDRGEAERTYGFRIYQGGVVPGEKLRIVEIEGWDVEACGGTHCATTGEVGFIKILKAERVQDGVERFIFVAGDVAVKRVQERDRVLSGIARALNTTEEKLLDVLLKRVEEWRETRKKLESYVKEWARLKAEEELKRAEEIGRGVKLAVVELEGKTPSEMITLGDYVRRMDKNVVVVVFSTVNDKAWLVVVAGDEVKRRGLHCGKLAGKILALIEGKGGGKPDIGQGLGKASLIDKAKAKIPELVREQVKVD